ncbi:hypothetical protein BGZ83_006536 [Gryganskiella cystojenkinii]|nr:hypothetical protein BGZ83_006536 [Gryganskiella cystojenkinii]
MSKDYYATLGVSCNADINELKQAYRQLARQYHPDKNTAPEATDKFQAISDAYTFLADPDKRKTFDKTYRPTAATARKSAPPPTRPTATPRATPGPRATAFAPKHPLSSSFKPSTDTERPIRDLPKRFQKTSAPPHHIFSVFEQPSKAGGTPEQQSASSPTWKNAPVPPAKSAAQTQEAPSKFTSRPFAVGADGGVPKPWWEGPLPTTQNQSQTHGPTATPAVSTRGSIPTTVPPPFASTTLSGNKSTPVVSRAAGGAAGSEAAAAARPMPNGATTDGGIADKNPSRDRSSNGHSNYFSFTTGTPVAGTASSTAADKNTTFSSTKATTNLSPSPFTFTTATQPAGSAFANPGLGREGNTAFADTAKPYPWPSNLFPSTNAATQTATGAPFTSPGIGTGTNATPSGTSNTSPWNFTPVSATQAASTAPSNSSAEGATGASTTSPFSFRDTTQDWTNIFGPATPATSAKEHGARATSALFTETAPFSSTTAAQAASTISSSPTGNRTTTSTSTKAAPWPSPGKASTGGTRTDSSHKKTTNTTAPNSTTTNPWADLQAKFEALNVKRKHSAGSAPTWDEVKAMYESMDQDKNPKAAGGTNNATTNPGNSCSETDRKSPSNSTATDNNTHSNVSGDFEVFQSNVPVRVVTLPVSILDLFHGTFKTVTVHRLLRPGSSRPAQWTVQIQIQAGWNAGTKVRYKGEGSDIFLFGQPLKVDGNSNAPSPSNPVNTMSGSSLNWVIEDLEFVIEEEPHPIYRRQGDDLLMDVPITLLEALFGGFHRRIRIPQKRDITAASTYSGFSTNQSYDEDVTHVEVMRGHRQGVIQSGEEQVFIGKGMPLPLSRRKKAGSKESGDLRVVFKVKLPTLSVKQEDILRDVLI